MCQLHWVPALFFQPHPFTGAEAGLGHRLRLPGLPSLPTSPSRGISFSHPVLLFLPFKDLKPVASYLLPAPPSKFLSLQCLLCWLTVSNPPDPQNELPPFTLYILLPPLLFFSASPTHLLRVCWLFNPRNWSFTTSPHHLDQRQCCRHSKNACGTDLSGLSPHSAEMTFWQMVAFLWSWQALSPHANFNGAFQVANAAAPLPQHPWPTSVQVLPLLSVLLHTWHIS